MRILIPLLGFAPQGGYRVLSELANSWARIGHKCTFLVPATSRPPYFPTSAEVIRCDRRGRIITERSSLKQRGYDSLLSLWSGLGRIGHNYDIILANHCLTAWPVRWRNAGNAKKFYYIQADEPLYYSPLVHPIKHLMARMSYRFGLTQIANSAVYRRRGIKPVAVIPPGIDLSIFTPKHNLGRFASEREIVLGTIGRTEPYKGTPTVLAAFRLLSQENQHLKMNVGFGNTPPADDIVITPISGDAALAKYYRSVDVLVVACTGQYGAPHYPVIEAMASGTPVVHTGYYPGSDGNSWEAENTSVAAVAEAIRQVISSTELERHAKVASARKTVEAELTWEVVASKFIEHFNA